MHQQQQQQNGGGGGGERYQNYQLPPNVRGRKWMNASMIVGSGIFSNRTQLFVAISFLQMPTPWMGMDSDRHRCHRRSQWLLPRIFLTLALMILRRCLQRAQLLLGIFWELRLYLPPTLMLPIQELRPLNIHRLRFLPVMCILQTRIHRHKHLNRRIPCPSKWIMLNNTTRTVNPKVPQQRLKGTHWSSSTEQERRRRKVVGCTTMEGIRNRLHHNLNSMGPFQFRPIHKQRNSKEWSSFSHLEFTLLGYSIFLQLAETVISLNFP
jgi:hypothetical protein